MALRKRAQVQEERASRLRSILPELDGGLRGDLPSALLEKPFTLVNQEFPDEAVAEVRAPRDVPQPSNPRLLRVSVLGLPNVGKSTLVNGMVADHINAVSPREFTTQRWTKSMTTVDDAQLVLLDTPAVTLTDSGNLHGRHRVLQNRRLDLAQAAWDSLHSADTVLAVVDGSAGYLDQRSYVFLRSLRERLETFDRKVPVVVAVSRSEGQPKSFNGVAQTILAETGLEVAEAVAVNRFDSDTILQLRRTLSLYALPGNWLYPGWQTTDLTMPEHVEEILHEKLCRYGGYVDGRAGQAALLTKVKVVGWTVRDLNVTVTALVMFAEVDILRNFKRNVSNIHEKSLYALRKTVDDPGARLSFHPVAVRAPLNQWVFPSPYRFYGNGAVSPTSTPPPGSERA